VTGDDDLYRGDDAATLLTPEEKVGLIPTWIVTRNDLNRAERANIDAALRFLEDAHAFGIEILGFTGGEPFLYPEFVGRLTRRAAALGFRFDKIISNGVWFRDRAHLETVLGELAEAGFTGKLGLSVDKFHGMHTPALAEFCRVARRVFERDNIVAVSYASRRPDQGLEPVHALARELDAVLDWSELLGRLSPRTK